MSERDLLVRASRVIDAVLAGEEPLRFGAVQALFGGLNPASCSHLPARLVEEGLLRREDDGYRVGPRFAQWRSADGPSFAALVRPQLAAIRDANAATAIAARSKQPPNAHSWWIAERPPSAWPGLAIGGCGVCEAMP